MHLHANAVLTVRQRQRLCDLVAAGVTISAAALIVGCSRQTASKWVNRGRRGESLSDRSSRPRFSPRLTPAAVEEAILQAREQLQEGPHVIGWAVGSRPPRCMRSCAATAAPAWLPGPRWRR
jgi:transposase-like protein